MPLNPQASKVLKFLADEYDEDYGCYSFAGIMAGTRIKDRKVVRRACRLLARKGLAEYHRSLWSEDGEPRGAGYGATKAGVAAAFMGASVGSVKEIPVGLAVASSDPAPVPAVVPTKAGAASRE